MFFIFAIPYMKYRDWKQSKKSKVDVYIPYINIWVKPEAVYCGIGVLILLVIIFGDVEVIGIKQVMRDMR